MISHSCFNLYSLNINGIEHLFRCMLAIWISRLNIFSFVFPSFLLIYKDTAYILDLNPLWFTLSFLVISLSSLLDILVCTNTEENFKIFPFYHIKLIWELNLFTVKGNPVLPYGLKSVLPSFNILSFIWQFVGQESPSVTYLA